MGTDHQQSKRSESHLGLKLYEQTLYVNDLAINLYFSIDNTKHLMYVNKTHDPHTEICVACVLMERDLQRQEHGQMDMSLSLKFAVY